MRYTTLILSLTLTMMSATIQSAQFCGAAEGDAPNTRYQANSDGTVLDIQTGLIWKRCAEGQVWENLSCGGPASYFTWTDALATAESTTFSGKSDWRLPNKKELQSLVEHNCYSPAINLSIFPYELSPYAVNDFFWSSSPVAGTSGIPWLVDFYYGYGGVDSKGNGAAVRLVRAGQ
jgi:hypothetical protein